MNAGKLIEKLEEFCPLSKAVNWDNPGLMAGRREKKVDRVFVALDACDAVIEEAVLWGADLLLTHHPMMMSPVKKVNTDDFTGRRLIRLIQNDTVCYAMHTNYDVVKMAGLSAQRLGLKDTQILEVTAIDTETQEAEGFGRIGALSGQKTVREIGELVKERFGLETVKIFGCLDNPVSTVAISPGSGKSMIAPAIRMGAGVLVSGDIGHHEGIDAADQGLAVIDAGHYGLEHIFIEHMTEFLNTHFSELEVKRAEFENPFKVLV